MVENNNTDVSPTSSEHGNYLKSIASNVGLPENRKFKLKYDYDRSVNVYSQAVVKDEEDEYEMDSFCCDEIIYESSSD